jgi:hypothetical protein
MRSMSAIVIGVTAPLQPACKRGIAANIAATINRLTTANFKVCIIDADSREQDVTNRFAASGPTAESFMHTTPEPAQLSTYKASTLCVVPNGRGGMKKVLQGTAAAIEALRDEFDVIVCDLPSLKPADRHVSTLLSSLLDLLVVTVTPTVACARKLGTALATTNVALTHIEGPFERVIICTGHENECDLSIEEVETLFREPVLTRVPQLWGRRTPNIGFGPAPSHPELDDAVVPVLDRVDELRRKRTASESRPVDAAAKSPRWNSLRFADYSTNRTASPLEELCDPEVQRRAVTTRRWT